MNDQSSFWSRRKAAVKAEEEAEARKAQIEQTADALEGKSDEEILEHFGLPDPATMKKGDDFSGFMSAGVPEHLKKIALRTLWRSNPVLANIDGLNEYDDDYRAAMLLSEPVKTAYQVGKGMKSHIDEMARKASDMEGVAEDGDEDALVESTEAEPTDSEAAALTDSGETEVSTTAPAGCEIEEVASTDVPLPRHMRFRFEEASA